MASHGRTLFWGFLNIVSLTEGAAVLSKNVINGSLFGIQNDKTGKPAWLVGGVFRMGNVKTTSPTFNATFYMMKLDGTAAMNSCMIIGRRLILQMINSTYDYDTIASNYSP